MAEISIGEFARRSRLSLKALRLYDERGVLVPSRVDQASGYRYYDTAQLEEAEGAFFSIHWGQMIADNDGLVEWCWPVPDAEASALAEHYPELTLRTEPAHREAFVTLPVGPGGIPAAHFQLAAESLRAWEQEQGIEDERLTLKPEDLGLRITGFLATGPVTERSVPDDYCDVAVPFA